jgi:hypothetical protein
MKYYRSTQINEILKRYGGSRAISEVELEEFKKEVNNLMEIACDISLRYGQYVDISAFANGRGNNSCLWDFKEVKNDETI